MDSVDDIFWHVVKEVDGPSPPDSRWHYFGFAVNRETIKRKARGYLGGDPDNYIVTPLTAIQERTMISISHHWY